MWMTGRQAEHELSEKCANTGQIAKVQGRKSLTIALSAVHPS